MRNADRNIDGVGSAKDVDHRPCGRKAFVPDVLSAAGSPRVGFPMVRKARSGSARTDRITGVAVTAPATSINGN
jgi:hypothetical protein